MKTNSLINATVKWAFTLLGLAMVCFAIKSPVIHSYVQRNSPINTQEWIMGAVALVMLGIIGVTNKT